MRNAVRLVAGQTVRHVEILAGRINYELASGCAGCVRGRKGRAECAQTLNLGELQRGVGIGQLKDFD